MELKVRLRYLSFSIHNHAGFPEQSEAEVKTQQFGNDNGGIVN
jgi:hypothetical protein